MTERERWKSIPNYEGLYEVSNKGKVKSIKRSCILLTTVSNCGYERVDLWKNGKKKRYSIHRLVAISFIPNPLNLPMVNHKDENRKNNNVDNLEWCDDKYNVNYGNAKANKIKKVSKAVVCVETGEVFNSQSEAMNKKHITGNHITDCCNGRQKTCGGYHWRYANER